MPKATITAVVVVLLILGGAGVYVATSHHQSAALPQPGEANQMNPPPSNQSTTTKESLKDLLAAGLAQKCDFADTTEASNARGTMYIGNGKMRGDFSVVSEGKPMMGHMITADQESYTWIDGLSTGFKSSLTAAASGTAATSHGVDANKKIDYTCSPWAVNDSYFSIPTDVQFNDLMMGTTGGVMPGSVRSTTTVTSGTPTKPGNGCSACDQLPDPQKSQCRAALYCS